MKVYCIDCQWYAVDGALYPSSGISFANLCYYPKWGVITESRQNATTPNGIETWAYEHSHAEIINANNDCTLFKHHTAWTRIMDRIMDGTCKYKFYPKYNVSTGYERGKKKP